MPPVLVTAGEEFTATTSTDFNQLRPSVTVLQDGTLALVWEDWSESPTPVIRGQVLDSSGTSITGEFTVSSDSALPQTLPVIQTLPDGNMVVAWSVGNEVPFTDEPAEIHAQILTPDGSKAGEEIIVSSGGIYNPQLSDITVTAEGNFFVSWSPAGASESEQRMHGRLFAPDGSPLGEETAPGDLTEQRQDGLDITALQDGGMLAVWTDYSAAGDDTDGTSIRMQRLEATGEAGGVSLVLNSNTSGDQYAPAAATLADGRVIVVWTDSSNNNDIRGRFVLADGTPAGGEFIISTLPFQEYPAVQALPDGGFVVSWRDSFTPTPDQPDEGRNLIAQRFDATGHKAGAMFMVNTTTTGWQQDAMLVPLEDGGLFAVWEDYSNSATLDYQPDGNADIKAQFFALVEPVTFNGTAEDDEASAPDDQSWQAYGNGGNDSLSGGNGNDFIAGGAGDDELSGGAGDNTLYGGNGADTLSVAEGLFGNTLAGEAGDDMLYGSAISDTLWGGLDNDFLVGDGGNDFLAGEAGDDSLMAGSGGDSLWGGIGSDFLWGDSGNDFLAGGQGDDTLYGNEDNDTLYGGNGTDALYGGENDDRLAGEEGDDTLVGDSGNDILFGGNGNDRLEGSDDNDQLLGESGDDTLEGGLGNDILRGGVGADMFNYSTGDGTDILVDFESGVDAVNLVVMAGTDVTVSDSGQIQLDGVTVMMVQGDGIGMGDLSIVFV